MLEEIIDCLPKIAEQHTPKGALYHILEERAGVEVEKSFQEHTDGAHVVGPFGKVYIPLVHMGNINSKHLFGLDELILFSFYWVNRKRYKTALDIGANIGLHTTILAKCGYEVSLYEPDTEHFRILQSIVEKNGVAARVALHNAAVSNRAGTAEFTRVLGNTTSSHLTGCKDPYGETETFTVDVVNIASVIQDADLIKMDVEGHEASIIQATKREHWGQTDALLEIGTPENAHLIYAELERLKLNAFAQKSGWKQVEHRDEMPTSYKEGSLFLTQQSSMLWG